MRTKSPNEKLYEGQVVVIYSPAGRYLDTLNVETVISDTHLYGVGNAGEETSYDLSDGIKTRIIPKEDFEKYPYLTSLDIFDRLKQHTDAEMLDYLEAQMRWYEEDATDEDIGECGANLTQFQVCVYGDGNLEEWAEAVLGICLQKP